MLQPFMPWMGSKRRLVPDLLKYVPRHFNTYHEPFLGSGSMLYALQPACAFSSDVIGLLVDLHKAVAQDTDAVCQEYTLLCSGNSRRDMFDDIKSRHPNISAAEFLFLIKNCHATRYSVNRQGVLTVPFGLNKSTRVPERVVRADVQRMKAASAYSSKHVSFHSEDALDALRRVKPGDFVFLDPPYDWVDRKESYYATGFGQRGWSGLITGLAAMPCGVKIMLTLPGHLTHDQITNWSTDVPDLHNLQSLPFIGSSPRGGSTLRNEWILTNYDY